jgi:endonuclease/exonuclease/phosphatase family metal-dependent hydrolase
VLLLAALTGWCRPEGTTGALDQERSRPVTVPRSAPGAAGAPYTLLQMNLCLSGLAGCWDAAAYPAVVREAAARVRHLRPDAVTVNEACRRDVAGIARRTGYHLRFSRVIYLGAPLHCVDPGGRGLFGDAVLTRARVVGSDQRAFDAQSGIEQRRWLCVTTRDVDVCTAHLSTQHTAVSAATNAAQCEELAALLARRAAARAVAFGGDVNRRRSCAPGTAWTRTDRYAGQTPGVQHAYGSRGELRSPSAVALPARHSNHDLLLVRARLVRR